MWVRIHSAILTLEQDFQVLIIGLVPYNECSCNGPRVKQSSSFLGALEA